MKNLLSKLNGPELKRIGLEHGEKIGLGVVVFTCLLILALGRWRGYDKRPEELNGLATITESSLKSTEWPESHRKQYAPVDYYKSSEDLLRPLDLSNYRYMGPISYPVYRKSEPIKEPQWEYVIDLIADPGRAILALAPQGTFSTELASSTANPDEATAKPNSGDEESELTFRRPPRVEQPPAAGAAGAAAMPSATGAKGAAKGGPKAGHGEASAGSAEAGMTGYGAGASLPVGEGRGIRFVSVRGAFPYAKQLDKLATALHLDSDHQAIDYLEFADFVIERQRAMALPDPWKDAKWEPLLLESAMGVLNECEGYALDVLDADYTSQIFTMPLPSLVEMEWRPFLANHPLLRKFQLDVEEQIARAKADEEVLKKFNEEGNKTKTRGGGFAGAQINMRGIRQSVLGAPRTSGAGAMMPSAMGGSAFGGPAMGGSAMGESSGSRGGMKGGHGADGASGMPGGLGMRGMPNPMAGPAGGHGGNSAMGEIMGRAGEQGAALGQRLQLNIMPKYLLFRYLDFDVEPGEAYRYRVKLIIRNPNYQREIELVEKPSIIEGETRETEWSQPSKPVVIEPDVQYFLAQVVKKTGQTVRAKNEVEWNIFQWAQKEGTFLNEKLKVALGQFVGGKTKTMVLNPAAPSFKEEKDREFTSEDLLVDSYGSAGVSLIPADHPDLNFNVKPNAKTAPPLNIPDQAVVVNRFGELVAFDANSGKTAELAVSGRVKRERDAFAYLKDQPEEDTGTAGGGLEGFIKNQKGSIPGGKGGDSKAKKKKNPIDGRSAGGGAGMMGMGGMGMPPGGAGEGGEGAGGRSKKGKSAGGK